MVSGIRPGHNRAHDPTARRAYDRDVAVATLPEPASRRLASRAGAISCGCALIAGATYVALVDPSESGGVFPPCPFHATTGLWCPGCGVTRGTHALLNGELARSLGYNVFTPFVLAAIAWVWFGWVRRSFARSPLRAPSPPSSSTSPPSGRSPRLAVWSSGIAIVVVVGYGVLRNLPGFAALAP
jgi:hypothetical protein